MEMNYHRWYSPALNRDMECKIYGQAGRPVLFIPCQNGRFYDFENYRMIDTWAPWIDAGKVMVFSVDPLDEETWSDQAGDPYHRIRRYEQWIQYITDEMVPLIHDVIRRQNGWEGTPGIFAFGCSLGATHAANLYFRRPELFDGLLALSGIYKADFGFGNYMDEVVYRNSPVDCLANMPQDHPYMELYNQKNAIFCTGQGPWEMPEATRLLQEILERKHINAWVDYWGNDSSHDWYWWHKQVAYYVPYLLGEREREEKEG